MSAAVVDALGRCNRPLKVDDLLKILHLKRRSKKSIEFVLLTLQAEGRVVRSPSGGFAPSGKLKTVEGVVTVQRSGMGFVSTGHGRDIYIHPANMGEAWNKDTVRVVILPGRRGQSPEGRVVEILRRGRAEQAVYAVKRLKNGEWVCLPADDRMRAVFHVDVSGLDGDIRRNDLLLVMPGEKAGEGIWSATAGANLEKHTDPHTQERLAKSNNAIPTIFPGAALNEAEGFARTPDLGDPGVSSGRRDLQGLDFVTIDGETAKDFDDAILVEETGGGQSFKLYVAIADVSHYVAPGSALDAEARIRGNSYYFPLSVEPMLPSALSNIVCSLNPGEPRLVMVAEMDLSRAGVFQQACFYPAIIKSKARLTYARVESVFAEQLSREAAQDAGVDAVADSGAVRDEKGISKPIVAMLLKARALAKALAALRRERKTLDFDLPEAEFIFDSEGSVAGIKARPHLFSHKLIEEFMIAANEAVARRLAEQGIPALYRVHPAPDEDKLATLFNVIKTRGLQPDVRAGLKKRSQPAIGDLCRLLEQARGSGHEYIINRLILRSMMQARYSPENEGHYGLASDCYCHFTSPIRRYADLTVHRALKYSLGMPVSHSASLPDAADEAATGSETGKNARKNKPASPEFLRKIAEHINATERTAMEAEREIHKRLAILYLQGKIGEEFAGTISGITEFGFFVELDGLLTDGMVRLSDLADDYYDFDPDRQELAGRSNNRRFVLGQRVAVKIAEASLTRLEINFSLVSVRIKTARH